MDNGNKATPIVYINCVDTLQYSFASHLSMEFHRKGISSFINSEGTLDVIERASAAVVVFSNNCFSSTLLLDKLVSLLQRRRQNCLVLVPVFYCISPDVMVLEHESSCSADQLRKWSSALQEMRDLPGHQFREECSECEFVEEIVKDVHEQLFPTEQIGINSRLLEIEHLLCKQPWGIRRIGIWGMPGIGKTTLAKAFFDQISGGYEASCFIKHFGKAFHEKGLHCLLEEHFGKILKELPRVCSSITRPSLPKDKLKKKRTLVVLDDVHNPLVAESFLGGFHWFGPGSLIIITSRDKQVFHLCQINHVYEVQSLNENEALQLFSHCAFLKDMREQNLLKLSMDVIDYANGNPLALNFFGRELRGKKQSEMETTFLKLKLRTPYMIHDLFKSSYESLNDNEKNIFLDIACFFNEENVDYVMRLLEACGFFPHVGIDVLVEKCLVTISENRVKMHRLIQDFGREIINGEGVQLERRRRLWEPWAIKFLLEDGEFKANGDPKATTHALATEDIEGISLDTSDILFDVKPTAFENMLNLRFLKIYCSNYDNLSGLRLPRGLDSLPYELRLLHWENYPLQSLPQDFDSCHLVELNMSYSQLQKLWGGTKNIDKLKIISLCHSHQLTQIDDICKAQNIELIDLQGCTKLQSFPATCQLQHLRVVNLSGCREIKSFPEVSPNIEELHLQGTGIRELPISIVTLSRQDKLHRELSNLLTEFSGVSSALDLEKLISRVQIVSSNQHLRKLVSLNMKDCVHLRSLPHMVDLESLKVLNMSGCSKLEDIQGFPRNLKELYLIGTAIKELPQLPQSLELLNAHGCVSLISFPTNFELLPRYYTFSNCSALSEKVVSEFVENALTNIAPLAKEQQELNKSLAFSFAVPSPASKTFTFNLQPGSSVMVQLGSSWRNTLGFAILVEVALLEDYHEACGFGISCVCRWKDKECVSHRLEKNFHCWTPGEGVSKDHMFVFCDLNMRPSTCEGKDPSILADLVVFEFQTVNKQKKLLDESCKVTKCGVHVITAANEDTSSNMTQPFSSSDYLQETFDNEVEEVLSVIYDGLDESDRNFLLYIACLFNDEDANFLVPLIANIGLGISSRLKVLANKSLIHISPYGIIVRHGLLQKIGREIVYRQSTLPGSSIVLDRDFGKVFADSSSLFYIWNSEIFSSFSEEDDCNNKISHLLAELKCKPISTVECKMKGIKLVGPKLVEAIRKSRCSIVVLSKNYASSSMCLDELVEIMNCKNKLAQKVVSIFYDVVPSDVRQQTGEFGKAFKNTCLGKSEVEKQKWARALADVANIAGVDSWEWDNKAIMIENLPQSFKMHSSMCFELKKLVDRIMRIFPDIEESRPGYCSGIQTLCLLYKALDKAKLLLQYCSESSKLYMAVTGDAILSRGSRAKKSLEQCLNEIRSMVPTVLDIKISQIVQDLRSTVLTLESSEAEAGKAVRELMRRSTSSSDSSDEIREFQIAALKLQLSTPEAIVIERRSLKLLWAKSGECEGNKRQILMYLLCLLKKHERIICADDKENSFSHHQSIDDSRRANVVEAKCSEEHNATLPEQFKCPLSLTVMYDPVIISSGHTFERMWIQKWFDEGNDSCPKSKRKLDDLTLEPNVAINNQISKWCVKHGIDVQDPETKHTQALHNIDFSVSVHSFGSSSIDSFGSSLCNIPDLSCFSITDLNSSYSIDSSFYSKISKGDYVMPIQTIDSASGASFTDTSHSKIVIEPLCGLTDLPWDEQIKVIEDVRSRFEHNTRAFRSMSPSKFLEPLITYLKNALEKNGTAGDIIKGGLDLLLAFLSGNRRSIESLEEDVFKMFSVFLESEVVAEEALNILEVLSNHAHCLSKITSTGSLSSLLKIVESRTEHLQEQAMITLKNLSSSNEICLEMVSLNFIQKLTSFLQQNIFCKHSIIVLRNLCNTEKGRVCITETPDCLASIADLLESNVPEEQENAISILLQLCVQKIEYCYLVVREVTDIYSSLLLIANNGTEEAKVGAAELLRALEEVDSNREEEEEESSRPEEETTASTTSQVVTSVTHQEPMVTTPAPKKSGLFGINFSGLKKKKR